MRASDPALRTSFHLKMNAVLRAFPTLREPVPSLQSSPLRAANVKREPGQCRILLYDSPLDGQVNAIAFTYAESSTKYLNANSKTGFSIIVLPARATRHRFDAFVRPWCEQGARKSVLLTSDWTLTLR